MPQDLTDDKSTLVQVMAWCRQATSHYLSQCWLSSLSPYGIARPQGVDINNAVQSYPSIQSSPVPKYFVSEEKIQYSGVPNSRTYQNKRTLDKICRKTNSRTPVLHYFLLSIATNKEHLMPFSHCVNSQTCLTIRDTGVSKRWRKSAFQATKSMRHVTLMAVDGVTILVHYPVM